MTGRILHTVSGRNGLSRPAIKTAAMPLPMTLWEEIENGIDRQGNPKYKWVPKDLSDQEIKRIISEKLP